MNNTKEIMGLKDTHEFLEHENIHDEKCSGMLKILENNVGCILPTVPLS